MERKTMIYLQTARWYVCTIHSITSQFQVKDGSEVEKILRLESMNDHMNLRIAAFEFTNTSPFANCSYVYVTAEMYCGEELLANKTRTANRY